MLVGAMLLWILGAFFVWQAWLVYTEQDDEAQISAARDSEIKVVSQTLTDARVRLQQVLASEAVTAPLAQSWEDGHAAASEAAKQALPELAGI